MDKFDGKMENYSKKTYEKMDTFLRTITDTVGTQLHGMNSTIVKMKEEEDDRYRQLNERIKKEEKKILDMDENRNEEPRGTHVDRNQGKAVITGFHNETSESEVIQLLKESITEIGMTMENVRIEYTTKPITHAFIHVKNDDERNKYVRSANMLRKEITRKKVEDNAINGRRGKISSKKDGYVKYCIHEKYNIPLDSITTNWTSKHISVKGQIVVKTCQSGRHQIPRH